MSTNGSPMSAYPLTWPLGQPRTTRRTDARFKVMMLGLVRDELLNELRQLNTRHVVLSTNLPTKRNGLPYAIATEPDDPGVAVYFDRWVNVPGVNPNSGGAWRPYVIACDHYRKLVWNMRAIWATVDALRTIQRHGASSMLEQAFTGFAALPPAGHVKPWWEVLGVDRGAAIQDIVEEYRRLVLIHHPDSGGNHERMSEINAAYEAAKKEIRP